MRIIEKYITPNKYSRPQIELQPVKAIVLHWLASPRGSGEGVYSWFENRKHGNDGYGSAHFMIEMDGDIYQYIPQNEMAYHVGSETYTVYGLSLSEYPNDCTIGIEMSHLDWEGAFTNETWNSAVKLTASLLQYYGLTTEEITTHNAVVGWKDCPRWFCTYPEEFYRFKKDVEKMIKYGNIVIATGDVNVRTGPGGDIIRILHTGEKVQLVGVEDGWNLIKIPVEDEDVIGYVSGRYLS